MLLQLSGTFACILSVLAFLPYIRDTLAGNTQPERASWLIWSVLSTISFFSQVYEGAGLSLWFAGSQVAGTVTIFLLSIKLGHGHYLTSVNKKLYTIALAGIITSFFYDSAVYALLTSIMISLLGGVKTVVKAFYYPHTETISTWIMALLASVFGLVSVGQFDLILLAYPLYLLTLYCSIVVAICAGRRTGEDVSLQPVYAKAGGVKNTVTTGKPELPLRHHTK